MRRPLLAAAGFVLVCCAGTSTTETAATAEAPATPEADKDAGFEATLEIDAEPGGKRFQGVWLVLSGGERLVVDYRATAWWMSFRGRKVRVTGEHWTPDPRAQSIGAAHFRVHELSLIDPHQEPFADPIGLGPERELDGQFEKYSWPEGTKLAGETVLVFRATAGPRYWLAATPDPTPVPEQPVRVRGRTVTPSPFAARPGGAYLWIRTVSSGGERSIE